jgi:hypothetical protein
MLLASVFTCSTGKTENGRLETCEMELVTLL